jgi:hypothetical protein
MKLQEKKHCLHTHKKPTAQIGAHIWKESEDCGRLAGDSQTWSAQPKWSSSPAPGSPPPQIPVSLQGTPPKALHSYTQILLQVVPQDLGPS